MSSTSEHGYEWGGLHPPATQIPIHESFDKRHKAGSTQIRSRYLCPRARGQAVYRVRLDGGSFSQHAKVLLMFYNPEQYRTSKELYGNPGRTLWPPPTLTRRQQEIYDYLRDHLDDFPHPPTLDELCDALGLSSRGSLHKQIQALIEARLVEPMNNLRRGIRLAEDAPQDPAANDGLPLYGYIAAGQPIEAIRNPDTIDVPAQLRTANSCYVLEVRGDSMIDEGILDGDWVVIEHREQARNGEIVVALVDGEEATLKRLEQKPGEVILHPANSSLKPMHYGLEQVQVQGVLVGQMRRYH